MRLSTQTKIFLRRDCKLKKKTQNHRTNNFYLLIKFLCMKKLLLLLFDIRSFLFCRSFFTCFVFCVAEIFSLKNIGLPRQPHLLYY